MKQSKHPDRLWDRTQVKSFVKQAVDRVGQRGWGYLSHEMREALVAQQFSRVVLMQARTELPGPALQVLWQDMLIESGLLVPEGAPQ